MSRQGKGGKALRPGVGPRPARPWKPWPAVGAGAVIVLVAVGAWWAKQSSLRPDPPPKADLVLAQAPVRTKIEAAISAVEAGPQAAAARAELARTYHAHGFLPEAQAAYAQAAALAPSDPRWPYLEALTLEGSEPERSLDRLVAAKALGAEGLAVDWHVGNLLAELGRTTEARRAFERGLVHDPSSAPLLAGRGRIRFQEGDIAGAAADLEAAVRADANWAESYALLAQVYGRLDRDSDAEAAAKLAEAARQLEQLGPPDPVYQAVIERGVSVRWLVRRGQLAAQAGRSQEAEGLFRQAIAADPGTAAGYLGLGATLQGRGDLVGAIGQYRLALEQRPDDVEALTNLGLALAQSGKVEEGTQHLEKALDLAPGHLGASLNLALVHLQAGRPEAALATVDSALPWQPGQRQLVERRASALTALGRHAEAAASWREVAMAAPRDPEPIVQQASALMQAGEHEAVLELLRRGLSTFPGNGRLQASLAWQLATAPDPALRDGTEAVNLARALVAAMPSSAQAQDVLATALAEAGDWEGAVAAAGSAVAALTEGDPVGPQIRERLALFQARRPFRQEGR